MIIGMVPMALVWGTAASRTRLGRAVIGGLFCATVATLVFVPSVFALFHYTSQPAASPESAGARQRQFIA